MINQRNYYPIDTIDLRDISNHAQNELNRFLYSSGNPPRKYGLHATKLIAICLFQGTAQPYRDILTARPRPKGIKDIDTWFFFKESSPFTIVLKPTWKRLQTWGPPHC